MDDRGGGHMILLTFHSVSSALYLEELLKQQDVGCRVIPVPRELSSSCGYAAEVDTDETQWLESLIDAEAIEWEGIYRVDGERFQEIATN